MCHASCGSVHKCAGAFPWACPSRTPPERPQATPFGRGCAMRPPYGPIFGVSTLRWIGVPHVPFSVSQNFGLGPSIKRSVVTHERVRRVCGALTSEAAHLELPEWARGALPRLRTEPLRGPFPAADFQRLRHEKECALQGYHTVPARSASPGAGLLSVERHCSEQGSSLSLV